MDQELNLIASRYAKALFAVSQKNRIEEVVSDQLKALKKSMKHGTWYETMLCSKQINSNEKVDFMVEILKEQDFHPIILSFFVLLIQKKRINAFFEIQKKYQQMYEKQQCIGKVTVKTANPITNSEKETVLSLLKRKTKYQKFIFTYVHDPALIGGICLEFKEFVIDASIRGRLERIKDEIRS